MKNIVILSGAGISAESGLSTFRGKGGLWEGHDVMEVASPVAWKRNMELVLSFYNERRRQLLEVEPNKAHIAIAELEKDPDFNVHIVTQNVDDLHERAGSQQVLHLHGELLKARSTRDDNLVYSWKKDLVKGDVCEKGAQLRPDVVWFGEAVPMMSPAAEIVQQSDALIIVGTSLQVYPAASLLDFADPACMIYYVDPDPGDHSSFYYNQKNLKIIAEPATKGIPLVLEEIKKTAST